MATAEHETHGVDVDDAMWAEQAESTGNREEDGPDVLDAAHLAMTSHDPLVCNAAAYEAGCEFVRCKLTAADKEARRKEYQLEIQKEYEAKGMSATPAEKSARGDARYVIFLAQLAGLSERRDRAEILFRTLQMRSALLFDIRSSRAETLQARLLAIREMVSLDGAS